jgi:hypothetical protein
MVSARNFCYTDAHMTFLPGGRWSLTVAVVMIGITIAGTLEMRAAAQSPQPVAVYVGPRIRDGFVDAGEDVPDSIKDIQNELKRPGVASVLSEGDADLVIVVLSRGTGKPAGAVGMPVGGTVVAVPLETRYVEAVLRVGAFEKSVTGTGDSWRLCARSVFRQIESWVSTRRSDAP